MIILDCVQGSPEWLHARLGIPTASNFDRIITPKTLKPSTQAWQYRNQLLAEWLLGYPMDWGGKSEYMERGTALEAEARAAYEMQRDVDVQVVGFIYADDRKLTGGSPDGLIGEDGGLELKCPAIHTHIGYLLKPQALVDEYRTQVQGYLWITGRRWWDLCSYHPDLPSVIRRIERDEAFVAALDAAVNGFLDDLLASRERLAPYREEAAAEGFALTMEEVAL